MCKGTDLGNIQLLAAVQKNYPAICAVYFLSSIGLGDNIPIDAAIALNRRFLVPLLGIWQPIGIVVASAIAFGTAAKYRCDVELPACNSAGLKPDDACCTVLSNMGWRYEVITIGAITFIVFVARYLVFTFHESLKFLISQGRDQDAIGVLHRISKFNKAPMPTPSLAEFQLTDSDADTYQSPEAATSSVVERFRFLRGLFLCKLQCFTFALLAIAYMGDYWSFTLAGSFLPIVLLRDNGSGGNVTETYRQYIYIYLPGILGALTATLALELSDYLKLTMQYFNAVLYASAPEMFNTTYRASASGMLSCLGRITSVVAPIAGQRFIAEGTSGVLWLGAGGIWLSALFMCFLPIEMRTRQMF
ncbi:uncharacterized protein N7473_009755 [Penicillium subrubescens]|uniref:uncharacterized protein n=1 Tax=Penicillium subrubescens TaxID=1316194 RepID=UPI0025450288|nr:uncharacterized protein N7473_009755 [Penicillium subrubescens]KAJ5882869.1 hypothetical protein N7473_009755 [Penicillium subrubescens]